VDKVHLNSSFNEIKGWGPHVNQSSLLSLSSLSNHPSFPFSSVLLDVFYSQACFSPNQSIDSVSPSIILSRSMPKRTRQATAYRIQQARSELGRKWRRRCLRSDARCSSIHENFWLGLDVLIPVLCEGSDSFSLEREDVFLRSKRCMTYANHRNDLPLKFLRKNSHSKRGLTICLMQ